MDSHIKPTLRHQVALSAVIIVSLVGTLLATAALLTVLFSPQNGILRSSVVAMDFVRAGGGRMLVLLMGVVPLSVTLASAWVFECLTRKSRAADPDVVRRQIQGHA
jgi:hypothetical protein